MSIVDLESLKQQAASAAVDHVRSGMVIGLGSGSTAEAFLRRLADQMQGAGLAVTGVPTSNHIETMAKRLGIPLTTLEQDPRLDLAVDGADEVDPNLQLIKGAGGSLLKEKLVAIAARRFLVIADQSKKVSQLGLRFPVPVEVVRFGWQTTASRIELLNCAVARRCVEGEPFVTDEQHYILDCRFRAIHNPLSMSDRLKAMPGVVEHGLFVNVADEAIIAGPDGVEALRGQK